MGEGVYLLDISLDLEHYLVSYVRNTVPLR